MPLRLWLCSLCLYISTTTSSPLLKTILPSTYIQQYHSRCLDGTPYGYYYDPAPKTSTHPNHWVLFLEGGGLCLTYWDCHARAKTAKGSSSQFSTTYLDVDGVLNDTESVNPFFDFNRVWLPYCSGDTHTGQQREENLYGLYFSGHYNIVGAVQHLIATHNLGNATHVLVSGGSAGGIGTFNNVDFIQDVLTSKVLVKAAPQAGYYFPNNSSLFEEWILGTQVPINDLFATAVTTLYDSYTNKHCRDETPTAEHYKCWDAHVNARHIKVPLLIVENNYDQNQIEDELLCPCSVNNKETAGYLKFYGDRMRASIATLKSFPGISLWMPSCFDHTDTLCMLSQVQLQGRTYKDVLSEWFFADPNAPHVWYLDDCGVEGPCNKNCHDYICHSQ